MSTFDTIPFRPGRMLASGRSITATSLGKPAAIYPNQVVTDAQLKIAVDRLTTTLAATLDTVSTSMTVADASHIAVNTLLSIDSELVWVNLAPSGNQVPIVRAFDGTTAAIHLTGTPVSGFVDAWHHNALVAEVEAIQQTLGANLSRVPAAVQAIGTTFNINDYNFAPQSPGGSLTAGITNTITLAPVPPGVNGTDIGHYLYLSGGTGTAETVFITGGTAVEGAASGTISFVPAFSHTGAWTIASATAGMQEAETHRLTHPGWVYIPAGTHNLQAPTSYFDGAVFKGDGDSSLLVPASSSLSVLVNRTSQAGMPGGVNSNHVSFRDFVIDGKANLTNTNYGIRMNLQNSAWVQSICDVYIANVTFNNIRYAIYGERTFNVLITNCQFYLNSAIWLTDTTGDPTYRSFHTTISNANFLYALMDGTGTVSLGDYFITLDKCVVAFLSNINITGTQGQAGGIKVTHASEGVVITDCSLEMFGSSGNPYYGIWFQERTWGASTASPAASQVVNTVVDMVSSTGILWEASTYNATNLQVLNCFVGSHSTLVAYAGIRMNGLTLSDIQISNTSVDGNYSSACIELAQSPTQITITGGTLVATNPSAPCLKVSGSTNYLSVVGLCTQAASGIALSETYGINANRMYWANTGPNPIVNFIRPVGDGQERTTTGNCFGRFYHGLIGGTDDNYGWTVNYNRTSATAGTLDSTTNGTSEIQLEGRINNTGLIAFRTGAVNTAPATVLEMIPGSVISFVGINYVPTETGANNAIAGFLPDVSLVDGIVVRVKLAHSLQAGANTFNLSSSGAVPIRSARNPANNIATPWVAGGIITLVYTSSLWLDISQ